MPAVNQRIPNFLGGVSQQPDTIKFPGQLRVCDNAVPDVTFGLMKRPPGEFVKKLTNANDTGYWYEILRDGNEKYLVQITPANTGSHPIRIWALTDLESGQSAGTELSLTNSSGDSLYSYLSGATEAYSIQTIQDYTLITNPQKTVGTAGNTFSPLNNGNYSFVRLDTVAYNTEYVLYEGSTPPTQATAYRVTAVKAWSKHNTSGSNGEFDPNGSPNSDDSYSGWDIEVPSTTHSNSLVMGVDSSGNGLQNDTGGVGWAFEGSDGTGVSNMEWYKECTGYATVNAQNYIYRNDSLYQSSDGQTVVDRSTFGSTQNQADGSAVTTGDNFIGFSAKYKRSHTINTTLTDGGLCKVNPVGANLAISIAGCAYSIKIIEAEEVKTYRGVAGIGFYASPAAPDDGPLSMMTILKAFKDGNSNFEKSVSNISNISSCEIIGNGLFIPHDSANLNLHFLGGAVNEGMTIIGRTAIDISRLPTQCKNGYVVQISNTENSDADDYYLKFIADAGGSGTGVWEECVRPHNFSSNSDSMVLGLDPATMPHALVNNRNGTFSFKKLDEASKGSTDNYWKDRDVGDDETNPFPSFNGQKIQKIFFHRNRLGFIANEQVVLSRPNNFFNFFIVSAITTSDDNPIDITVSDTKPAFINHVLPIQKGIMMFSDNGQFLLFTESDIFSSKTARLKKVSSYECDASLQPRDLGTSVMFTSSVAAYTRAYEAVILDDDVPPKILEQTRVVPEYVPKDITISANSSGLGIVTFGKKNSSDLYHYKYFDSGEKREQSAWYSWGLTGTLQYMTYTGGNFHVVTKQGSDYILSRHEYITDATATRSYTVGGSEANVGSRLYTARWFEACLDNMAIPSSITYTSAGGANIEKTVLSLPYTPTAATNFYAIGLNGTNAGIVIKADSVGTDSATFNGVNMTGWEVAVGYGYTSTIELPNYYLATEANRYDTDAALRVSGLNFELGVSGPMEFHLTAKNSYTNASGSVTPEFDDYIQYESGMKTGLANFGEPPSELNKSVRVPIQKKNTKYNLQIKIPDPFSTALISASWDGNYNQRRHVRR